MAETFIINLLECNHAPIGVNSFKDHDHDQVSRDLQTKKFGSQSVEHCRQLQCLQEKVNRVLKHARELVISWPLDKSDTDAVLAEKIFPSVKQVKSNKRMPDYNYNYKELLQRRCKKISTIFCSQYEFEEWYDQLGGDDSPLADVIIDRIAQDSYRINVTSIGAKHDTLMLEVYGLDKTLRN